MEDLLFFSFNEKSSVLLIGFFNAMVFSFLLLRRGISEDQRSSRWLAGFVFMGGLYLCPFMLGYAGWYSTKGYPNFMFYVPFQQLFLIGPVFYFYIKTLLDRDFKLTRSDLLHFAPAAAYLLYSLVVFVGDQIILQERYFYADGRDKDLSFWYQMTGLVSMLYYLLISLKYYQNYRKRSIEEVSFADEVAYKWIQYFAIAFSLILVLRVVFFITNPEWGNFGSKYWYYLCFAVLLLYISITGYSNTIRTAFRFQASRRVKFEPVEEKREEEPKAEESEVSAEWKDRITRLFEQDKVYENPSLTLSEVASLLHTNRNIISKAINQEFDLNFNDFVNQKRAEAVIEKLHKGEHTNITLLSIAYDCGFNSKTTFNRAFKKHTGVTPKQFIAQNKL